MSRQLSAGRISELKTEKSQRRIPLGAALAQRLRDLGAGLYLFRNSEGGALNPQNAMARYVKPAAEKVGIAIDPDTGRSRLNWHSFRHSFTVALRQQGAHPKAVSALLGHSRVQLHMDVYDSISVSELPTLVLPTLTTTADAA